MSIDKKFWDGKRWNGHAAFNTYDHTHVSCFWPAEGFDTCDLGVVACRGDRWYVEDTWSDGKGVEGVFAPWNPSAAEPKFFDTEQGAIRFAVSVVAKISGVTEASLLMPWGLDA